ncbi:collagen alpha-1(I) chain-like [Athene cunicularia]|uniref:collagen alpha-1(I) chain-like n=1 Tax=Athene cunicularia TaxID=194338 RepID=UPI000EF6925D|nr:collagen alpha-1(I) chain-like [Athene cunicularia]
MVCIRTESEDQASFCPSAPREVSVLPELALGHLRYALTGVPPQSNSPPAAVPGAGHARHTPGAWRQKREPPSGLAPLPHRVLTQYMFRPIVKIEFQLADAATANPRTVAAAAAAATSPANEHPRPPPPGARRLRRGREKRAGGRVATGRTPVPTAHARTRAAARHGTTAVPTRRQPPAREEAGEEARASPPPDTSALPHRRARPGRTEPTGRPAPARRDSAKRAFRERGASERSPSLHLGGRRPSADTDGPARHPSRAAADAARPPARRGGAERGGTAHRPAIDQLSAFRHRPARAEGPGPLRKSGPLSDDGPPPHPPTDRPPSARAERGTPTTGGRRSRLASDDRTDTTTEGRKEVGKKVGRAPNGKGPGEPALPTDLGKHGTSTLLASEAAQAPGLGPASARRAGGASDRAPNLHPPLARREGKNTDADRRAGDQRGRPRSRRALLRAAQRRALRQPAPFPPWPRNPGFSPRRRERPRGAAAAPTPERGTDGQPPEPETATRRRRRRPALRPTAARPPHRSGCPPGAAAAASRLGPFRRHAPGRRRTPLSRGRRPLSPLPRGERDGERPSAAHPPRLTETGKGDCEATGRARDGTATRPATEQPPADNAERRRRRRRSGARSRSAPHCACTETRRPEGATRPARPRPREIAIAPRRRESPRSPPGGGFPLRLFEGEAGRLRPTKRRRSRRRDRTAEKGGQGGHPSPARPPEGTSPQRAWAAAAVSRACTRATPAPGGSTAAHGRGPPPAGRTEPPESLNLRPAPRPSTPGLSRGRAAEARTLGTWPWGEGNVLKGPAGVPPPLPPSGERPPAGARPTSTATTTSLLARGPRFPSVARRCAREESRGSGRPLARGTRPGAETSPARGPAGPGGLAPQQARHGAGREDRGRRLPRPRRGLLCPPPLSRRAGAGRAQPATATARADSPLSLSCARPSAGGFSARPAGVRASAHPSHASDHPLFPLRAAARARTGGALALRDGPQPPHPPRTSPVAAADCRRARPWRRGGSGARSRTPASGGAQPRREAGGGTAWGGALGGPRTDRAKKRSARARASGDERRRRRRRPRRAGSRRERRRQRAPPGGAPCRGNALPSPHAPRGSRWSRARANTGTGAGNRAPAFGGAGRGGEARAGRPPPQGRPGGGSAPGPSGGSAASTRGSGVGAGRENRSPPSPPFAPLSRGLRQEGGRVERGTRADEPRQPARATAAAAAGPAARLDGDPARGPRFSRRAGARVPRRAAAHSGNGSGKEARAAPGAPRGAPSARGAQGGWV